MSKVEATLAAVTATVLACIAACSAPPPNKTPLIVCQAGEDGCPGGEKAKAAKKGAIDTPASTPAPTRGDDPPPSTTPVAGPAIDTDAAAPAALGPECTKLKACCEALVANGYLTTCNEPVSAGLETGCHERQMTYVEDPEGLLPEPCTIP